MDEVVNLVFIVGKVGARQSAETSSRFHSPSSLTYVKHNVVKTSHSAGLVIITVPASLFVVGGDAVGTFPFVCALRFPRASRRSLGGE